jgi:nicotinate dehydrogenase subunit B
MNRPQRRADGPRTRAEFLAAEGVLVIVREPPAPPPPAKGQPPLVGANPAEGVEVLLAVWDDGSVTGLSGHVDLGTGLQTALGQIVADELDLPLERVRMVLGDTARAPNQGATIASASIQIHAVPLRQAAAQAAAWLRAHGGAAALAGRREVLVLDPQAPVKRPADYRLVGTSAPRVDIGPKLAGETVFVHDMRVPGMLHGRVVGEKT